MRASMFTAIVLSAFGGRALAWDLLAYPEFFRCDPFGKVVNADYRGERAPQALKAGADGAIELTAARNGYVSFHLTVRDDQGGRFKLKAASATPGVEIDLFREWFHRNRRDERYYPDALIPVGSTGGEFALPDAEMKIDKQTTAAFWVDVYVSKQARPGVATAAIELSAGGKRIALPLRVRVQELTIPDRDTLTADHNLYGLGFVARYFKRRRQAVEKAGKAFFDSDEYWQSVHDFHKLYYEHRGLVHCQGGNHVGTVRHGFVPELTGSGRVKKIKSWKAFDRHYGPLLDGSAFEGTRRGPRPIETMYLPINMEWPASYVNWGRPGYEVEFVNVVSAMEKHFRRKGWTNTCFEMFFRHKKRYKGFAWDGDEPRFEKDNAYFVTLDRMLKKAVPRDSPVKFVHRADVSWLMRQQFDDLKGVITFWVCSGGILSFYPEAPAMLKARSDKVWFYTGTPSAFGSTLVMLDAPVKAWMYGLHGYERWNVSSPGADPWFKFTGGTYCLTYPGDGFGIDGPIPGIRLKIQRNCLQDIALLDLLAERLGEKPVREKVAAFAKAVPMDWWNPGRPITKIPVIEWSNATIGRNMKPPVRRLKQLDGRWWLAVRQYALVTAGEEKK